MQKLLGLIFFITLGLFYSCAGNNGDTVDKAVAEREARQLIYNLSMTSDTLYSSEQKAFVSKMKVIIYERCAIKNKRFELSITKQEFKTMGVPEIYYDVLKRDIEDMNRCLDSTGIMQGFIPDSIINAFNKSQDEYFAAKKLNSSNGEFSNEK